MDWVLPEIGGQTVSVEVELKVTRVIASEKSTAETVVLAAEIFITLCGSEGILYSFQELSGTLVSVFSVDIEGDFVTHKVIEEGSPCGRFPYGSKDLSDAHKNVV